MGTSSWRSTTPANGGAGLALSDPATCGITQQFYRSGLQRRNCIHQRSVREWAVGRMVINSGL